METKTNWYKILLAALIVVNIASLAAMWFMRLRDNDGRPAPGGDASAFIIRELRLDSAQAMKFRALRDEHRDSVERVKGELREAKDLFFAQVSDSSLSREAIDRSAIAVARIESRIDALTLDHFRRLRQICTPVQQARLDHIVSQLLRMIAPPPGRPPRGTPGQGPPPGEEPPQGQGPPPGEGPPPAR